MQQHIGENLFVYELWREVFCVKKICIHSFSVILYSIQDRWIPEKNKLVTVLCQRFTLSYLILQPWKVTYIILLFCIYINVLSSTSYLTPTLHSPLSVLLALRYTVSAKSSIPLFLSHKFIWIMKNSEKSIEWFRKEFWVKTFGSMWTADENNFKISNGKFGFCDILLKTSLQCKEFDINSFILHWV